MTSVATPATSLDASLHGKWNLDRTHSHIEFAVRHMGVATFRGSFADIDATFTADAGSVQLSGSAQARSITTADENLHGHLMSPEFFDVEKYAEVTFSAASLERTGDDVQLDGTLTIKGKEMEEDKKAIAEYGTSDSGASLGDILGAAIRRRNQMSSED